MKKRMFEDFVEKWYKISSDKNIISKYKYGLNTAEIYIFFFRLAQRAPAADPTAMRARVVGPVALMGVWSSSGTQ